MANIPGFAAAMPANLTLSTEEDPMPYDDTVLRDNVNDPTEIRPHKLRLLYPYYTHSKYLQHLVPSKVRRTINEVVSMGRNYEECDIGLVDKYISRRVAEIYMDPTEDTGQFHIRNPSDKVNFLVDNFTVKPGEDVELWHRSRIRFEKLQFGEIEGNNYIEFICELEISNAATHIFEVSVDVDENAPLYRCAREYAHRRAPWTKRLRTDPENFEEPYNTHMRIIEQRREAGRPWDNRDIDLVPKNPRNKKIHRKAMETGQEPYLWPEENEPPPPHTQQVRPSLHYGSGGFDRHHQGMSRDPFYFEYDFRRNRPVADTFYQSDRYGFSSDRASNGEQSFGSSRVANPDVRFTRMTNPAIMAYDDISQSDGGPMRYRDPRMVQVRPGPISSPAGPMGGPNWMPTPVRVRPSFGAPTSAPIGPTVSSYRAPPQAYGAASCPYGISAQASRGPSVHQYGASEPPPSYQSTAPVTRFATVPTDPRPDFVRFDSGLGSIAYECETNPDLPRDASEERL